MNKHKTIILASLLGISLAACNKSETPAPGAGGGGAQPSAPGAPAVPAETLMRQAYGFAAQMPANTASYAGFYQLGKLWDDLKNSKTWAAIKANPLVSKTLNDESFLEGKKQMEGNPEAVKWKAILKEALGNEAFIAFADGSAPRMSAWMRLNDDVNVARFNALLSGRLQNNPYENLISAVLSNAKDLDIPPMIIGFKVTSQKAALDSELAKIGPNLPPFVETGTFNLSANQPFTSYTMKLSKALPPETQDELKMMISADIPDPQKADATYQAVLSRQVEIAYGYVGDYFIISIGPDHSHLKFVTNYADSLLARPEVQKAADYAGKPVLSFSWGSAEMMAACRQQFQLMSYYDKLRGAITQALTPDDIVKLEADLKRLDAEGAGIFSPEVTAMVGVEYRDNGLHGEMFGGVKRPPASVPMKFSQVPTDSTFLWLDEAGNQGTSDTIRTWVEDFASTAYDVFQWVAVPQMSETDRQQMTQSEAQFVKFYKITRDEFAKSLGLENAFAMDLNGEVPDVPMLPPELHTSGKAPRFAYLSDVRDRALLAQSWESYLKLANEIVQSTPLMMEFPMGLPLPANEVVDGVSLSYYKLPPPVPAGDLVPIVAVTDKTFVASLSRSYALELSKAASKPGADKQMSVDFRLNLKPAFDFVDKWMVLAAQYPELFFSNSEDDAASFKKSAPDIHALLQTLRVFTGMSVQVYEENGVPRISTVIGWVEK